MTPHFPIRTDLAVEAREDTISGAGEEQLSGVLFQQQEEGDGRIQVSRVLVQSEEGPGLWESPGETT